MHDRGLHLAHDSLILVLTMITKNKLYLIWLFGSISGFTLMISGNTLNFWLAKEQIGIKTIGFFAIVSIPYAINFIWAPIFDTQKLWFIEKFLGLRVSWIAVIYLLLSIFIFTLSLLTPNKNLLMFACTSVVISLLSSAGDTVLGALRTEIISKESQGTVTGFYILGYRIGTLLSGSCAIYLSAYTSWNNIYKIFAFITLLCPVLIIFNSKNINAYFNEIPLPYHKDFTLQKYRIINLINTILKPVGSWYFIIIVLIFLVLYRLPDNFIQTMINPFLLHLHYDEIEIASIGKFFGTSGAIIGGLISSLIMKKHRNIIKALLVFGVLHAIAHSLFIMHEMYGKNTYMLFIVIGFESVSGGMVMAAYISFIASLCQGKFRATQYSFFSSMMGLSRSILPSFSGYFVAVYGWHNFFVFVTLATIPSLILAWILGTRLVSKN